MECIIAKTHFDFSFSLPPRLKQTPGLSLNLDIVLNINFHIYVHVKVHKTSIKSLDSKHKEINEHSSHYI